LVRAPPSRRTCACSDGAGAGDTVHQPAAEARRRARPGLRRLPGGQRPSTSGAERAKLPAAVGGHRQGLDGWAEGWLGLNRRCQIRLPQGGSPRRHSAISRERLKASRHDVRAAAEPGAIPAAKPQLRSGRFRPDRNLQGDVPAGAALSPRKHRRLLPWEVAIRRAGPLALIASRPKPWGRAKSSAAAARALACFLRWPVHRSIAAAPTAARCRSGCGSGPEGLAATVISASAKRCRPPLAARWLTPDLALRPQVEQASSPRRRAVQARWCGSGRHRQPAEQGTCDRSAFQCFAYILTGAGRARVPGRPSGQIGIFPGRKKIVSVSLHPRRTHRPQRPPISRPVGSGLGMRKLASGRSGHCSRTGPSRRAPGSPRDGQFSGNRQISAEGGIELGAVG